jgi:opacity protein-like surface antigen
MKKLFAAAFLGLAILATSGGVFGAGWTGAYIGVNGTYTVPGSLLASRDGSGQPAIKPSGPVVGLQAGYQYRFASNLVIGAEADYQFVRAKGSGNSFQVCPASVCGTNVTERDSVSVSSVGTVRGRIGFAFGRYLPYVTAGYAYGHATGQATFSAVLPPVIRGINATGWVAGGGLDYHMGGPWSVRAEYTYLTLSEGVMHFRANVVRVGVNYRF